MRALADDLPRWDTDGGVLVCRQIRTETHDVKTFVFAPRSPAVFRFRPGQFMTFEFDVAGRRISRCYTLSSPPTRNRRVSITVKRTPGGVVSNWLHDALRPGAEVAARGPFGTFTLLDHPAPKYLLLSGGSGATPLMSAVRTLHDLAADLDVVYVHCARTPQDVLFRGDLAGIARDLPGFRAVHVCERDGPTEPWHGYRGRLFPEMLRTAVPDVTEREVLSCGPPEYLAAVRALLAELGCDPARCHEESFLFEPTATPPPGAGAGAAFRVEFTASGRAVKCGPGSTVLDAADEAGVPVPTSCRQGLCGTCKTTLVSGRVDMSHAGGIRDREIAQGKILLCCARPLTDLVVDR